MGKIIIEDIEIYAYHGVMPEENKIGTRFVVNLEISLDLQKAVYSDNLEDTFNYEVAYNIVHEETSKQYQLIEHLAGRILQKILNSSAIIESVKVKVSKLNPPFGGDVKSVSVVIEESKK